MQIQVSPLTDACRRRTQSIAVIQSSRLTILTTRRRCSCRVIPRLIHRELMLSWRTKHATGLVPVGPA